MFSVVDEKITVVAAVLLVFLFEPFFFPLQILPLLLRLADFCVHFLGRWAVLRRRLEPLRPSILEMFTLVTTILYRGF